MSDEQESKKSEESPAWKPMGGGPPRHPQFVLRQVQSLEKLRELVEGIVAQKEAEVGTLQEKLLRLRHGGGS